MNRWSDWWNQALKDLEHAKRSLQAGDLEWAAFAAQQAAEKAVNALILSLGCEHGKDTVDRLLQKLPAGMVVPVDVHDAARRLDQDYLPERSPDGLTLIFRNKDLYTNKRAEGVIRDAEKILEFCRSRIPGKKKEGPRAPPRGPSNRFRRASPAGGGSRGNPRWLGPGETFQAP